MKPSRSETLRVRSLQERKMQIKGKERKLSNAPRISRSVIVAPPADERLSMIPLHRLVAPLLRTLSLKLPRSKSKKLEARREGGGTGAISALDLRAFGLAVVVGFGKCKSMSYESDTP